MAWRGVAKAGQMWHSTGVGYRGTDFATVEWRFVQVVVRGVIDDRPGMLRMSLSTTGLRVCLCVFVFCPGASSRHACCGGGGSGAGA